MSKFFKYKRNNLNLPAFSLVEIMAVMLIVSLGLVGTVNLAIQNIQAQTINNDNLVAYQLSQEGLELVRQIRDTNWLQGNDWLDGLGSNRYCLDYRNLPPVVVAAVNSCSLYLDENNYYYSPTIDGSLSTANGSKFSRILEINAATSSASVKSIVSWVGRNNSVHSYTAETQLYDWY
ncbi:MAG: hypothetical protein PHE20_00600 [Patescibacteria group bacterium]|nr:hypothetical protein [Patescibacteria group bacterium]